MKVSKKQLGLGFAKFLDMLAKVECYDDYKKTKPFFNVLFEQLKLARKKKRIDALLDACSRCIDYIDSKNTERFLKATEKFNAK